MSSEIITPLVKFGLSIKVCFAMLPTVCSDMHL